jgi:hypothetical protein
MKYILEIRKVKDCSLKKKKDLKAETFSEALDEQARYEERMSERVYSHIREI